MTWTMISQDSKYPRTITFAIFSDNLMFARIYWNSLVIPICEFIYIEEE